MCQTKSAFGRRRDAPLLLQPRLEVVCLKVRRTVSCETVLHDLQCAPTARPAAAGVQRLPPLGGALHARATRWASCAPSSLRAIHRAPAPCGPGPPRKPGGDVRLPHARHRGMPRPPARRRSRHRSSPGPASPWLALSRMRAWVSPRAGAVPCPIKVRSRARSASDKTTTYFLRILGSSSSRCCRPIYLGTDRCSAAMLFRDGLPAPAARLSGSSRRHPRPYVCRTPSASGRRRPDVAAVPAITERD